MNTNSKISIDLSPCNASPNTPMPQLKFVQGDCYTRRILISLLSDGVPWSPPEGTICGIRYSKPDGTHGSYDTLLNGSAAWELDGNTLSLTLAPQMLTTPGCVNAQAMLIYEDQILNSFTIQIIVVADPSHTSIHSENYFNWHHWISAQLSDALAAAIDSGEFIGKTPSLSIGTVTTLPTGSDATAYIHGSAEAPVLDLGIPRGADLAVDTSLTQSGKAADAKSVGDRLAEKADQIKLGTFLGNIDTVDNSDNIHLNSVVWVNPETVNNPYLNSWGYCVTTAAWEDAWMQTIYYIDQVVIRRMFFNGSWSGWLWVNPPMIAGVEYKTAERYCGLDVYTLLINCGSLTSGSTKTIEFSGLAGCKVLRYEGTAYNANGDRYAIPSIYGTLDDAYSVYATIHSANSAGWAKLWSGSALNGMTADLRIWYVKE